MQHRRIWGGAAALAVGTALMALPATALATPVSTPTNLSATGTTGDIAFAADSTAAFVQFGVDGTRLPAVAVSDGKASLDWPSWGQLNGTHRLTAADCDTADDCGADSGPTSFTVANGAPVITTPTNGATVLGGFTVSGTFPGGLVKVLIDGKTVTTATGSHFSYHVTDSLAPGSHTVTVTSCSLDGLICDGPKATARLTETGLHPRITKVSPSPFSPNGDGVKDTATVAYQLDQPNASVILTVRNSNNSVVYSRTFSRQASGNHSWVWNGRRSTGNYVSSGRYTVELDATSVVDGMPVSGRTTAAVTVDTTAPGLGAISGSGSTFYPVYDGYKDYFKPQVTVGESGTLRLRIYSGSHVIRTISGSRRAGRTGMTWNGRRSSGALVAPGQYGYTFTATDAVGNQRTSARYTVYVSGKRLLSRTVGYTKNGNAFTYVGANNAYCVQYSTGISEYTHGVWLDNVCDPYSDGASTIQAHYSFAIPGAVKYGSVSVSAYGSTMYDPSGIFAAYYDGSGNLVTVGEGKAHAASKWAGLGGMGGSHIWGGHVQVAVGVDDSYNDAVNSSDYDLAAVHVTLHYYVLG